jgi:hypothetical protein
LAEGLNDAVETDLENVVRMGYMNVTTTSPADACTDLAINVCIFFSLVDGVDDRARYRLIADIFGCGGERHGGGKRKEGTDS